MKPCVTYYVGAGVVDASWPQPTRARSRGTQQGYLLAGEQQSRQDRYGDGPEAATGTGGNLTTPDAGEQQGRLDRYGDGLGRQPEDLFLLPGISRKPHMQ